MLAFAVTGVGGLALKKLHFQLPKEAAPVAWATLVGGVLIIGVERWLRGKSLGSEVTWKIALVVGLAQLAAGIFPGLSRSGSTILIALALGLGRSEATEFSFLLGIPTILSASALELYSVLKKPDGLEQTDWPLLALGTIVAAVSAFAVVKWLLHFVRSHTFTGFGWYRIGLGILLLLLLR